MVSARYMRGDELTMAVVSMIDGVLKDSQRRKQMAKAKKIDWAEKIIKEVRLHGCTE